MDQTVQTISQVRLQWFGLTHQGKVRKNNEDAFLGLQFNAQEAHHLGKVGVAANDEADFVFAVSDGMGGAMAGEFASKITVEKVTRLLPRAFKMSASGIAPDYADVMGELFEQVHRALTYLGQSYPECEGMGATLSLGWFAPGWLYFGHVGDSRIYYLPAREGKMRQVTHDDTYVGWLFRNGQINEREARNHPRRNALQKALGADHQFIDPQVGAIAYEPGDRFLFCTDGLVDGLYDSSIEEIMRLWPKADSANNVSQQLVHEALTNSGRDNITALVVDILPKAV